MTNPMTKAVEQARFAFIAYLENECGHVAVNEREDGIIAGREDHADFIAGYVAAKEDNHD